MKSKPIELDLFSPSDFNDEEKGNDNRTREEEEQSQIISEDITSLFHRLSLSKFRSSFYLNKKDRDIISDRGLTTIREHAQQIIAKRLAPAIIPNDGRQTPMRHGTSPVFIAQHATGCCCRGCLEKWHHIPKGRALTTSEQKYIVDVIMQWIGRQNIHCIKQIITILVLLILPICAMGDNSQLYKKLDSTLAQRNSYIEAKEKSLRDIKQGARFVNDNAGKLRLYESLANGYQAYIYDSAMTYVNKGLALSKHTNNTLYCNKFQIIRANLLISRGFYAEAKEELLNLNIPRQEQELNFIYHCTLYVLYNNWTTYCENNEFSQTYDKLKLQNIKEAIRLCPQKNAFYYYLLGEYNYFINSKSNTIYYYKKVLAMEKLSHRLYAMAAFALSLQYKKNNNHEQTERYLILAAISDIMSATKENVALQDVALFLYQNKCGDLKKAQEYINISLKDAYAYNNRLRRLEISSKLQLIMTAYADKIKYRNILLNIALVSILILLSGVVVSSYFIRKKNRLLSQKKEELSMSAEQMNSLNHQLNLINEELKDTNKKRENLVKVYIDLCYKYIERLYRFRTLVKRKIMANQSQELLSTLSSSRTTEKEDKDFLSQFDKTFLSLYPTFVRELNELLVESAHIQLKRDDEMPPILRVFALIRLGITESSKIAGILSYSPQTIYNYRSSLKNNALDKDHFEENVLNLCTVIA